VYKELTENVTFAKEAKIIKDIDYLTVVAVENEKSVSDVWKINLS